MGLALSVVGGHGALWFAMADDHLKLRDKVQWPYGVRGIKSVFFDLYIVRIFAWLVALIPAIVCFAVVKLAFIPLCVLRSVDPDLMRHASFYRDIAGFLLEGCQEDMQNRLWIANSFLVQARHEKARLSSLLEQAANKIGKENEQGRLAAWQTASCRAVRVWASEVGLAKSCSSTSRQITLQGQPVTTQADQEALDTDIAAQQAILESLALAGATDGKIAKLRRQMRRLRIIAFIEDRLRNIRMEMGVRSELFRAGISLKVLRRDSKYKGLPSAYLRIVACVALASFVICAIPLAVNHVLFILLGLVLPLWELPACASGCCGPTPSLQCVLGAVYLVLLGCAALLVPKVLRNQVLWADLIDLHGFPSLFYSKDVIVEIRWRHERDAFLKTKMGHFLTHHTLSYIEEKKPS